MKHSQTFSQTPLPILRNFKSWFTELKEKASRKKIEINLDLVEAEMYYNGGYSPKMTIHEILKVPFNEDLFSC